MKLCLTILFLLLCSSFEPSQSEVSLDDWKKAVVNIETESSKYPQHVTDSVLTSLKGANLRQTYVDSLKREYQSSVLWTGTAIYAVYKGRTYLITARHVLFDPVSMDELDHKIRHQQQSKLTKPEAIYPRVSIRTPFEYFRRVNHCNDFSVLNYNYVPPGPKPYYFTMDSSVNDGIGIVSLQAGGYRMMDTLLHLNGYEPIPLEKVCSYGAIEDTDPIVNISYPEVVSVVKRVLFPSEIKMHQSGDVVVPFTMEGKITMYNPSLSYFYADITTSPGSSGSPIIKNGKLIGLVSGANKYGILDGKNIKDPNLYSVGHFVLIVSTSSLCQYLDRFRHEEDQLAEQEKAQEEKIKKTTSRANFSSYAARPAAALQFWN